MKKFLSAIAIMALMIVFASCTNSRKDGGGSLYEPFMQKVNDHVRMLCIVHIARIYRAHAITREKKYQSMMNDE